VIDFFNRLFGREPSSTTARERLRLVLLSDHLSLAPDVIEALKGDLIEVISRYVEVDAANCDVTFEQQETRVAMLANIPILGMRSRHVPRPPTPPAPAEQTASAATSVPAQSGAVTRRRRRRKASGISTTPAPQAT
jgi:cell division topological specificity factor